MKCACCQSETTAGNPLLTLDLDGDPLALCRRHWLAFCAHAMKALDAPEDDDESRKGTH